MRQITEFDGFVFHLESAFTPKTGNRIYFASHQYFDALAGSIFGPVMAVSTLMTADQWYNFLPNG